MPAYEPGTVTTATYYTFICALCECEDYIGLVIDKNDAEKKMRRSRWSKTSKYGWMCPACVKKRKGE